MAASNWKFFNTFRLWEADGTLDMDLDPLYISLHSSSFTPNAESMSVYADLTNELASAGGYLNGTVASNLLTATFSRSTSTVTLTVANKAWSATATISPKYAVVRANVTRNAHVSPLIAYCDLDTTTATATATTNNGQTLTIRWPTGLYIKQGGTT